MREERKKKMREREKKMREKEDEREKIGEDDGKEINKKITKGDMT